MKKKFADYKGIFHTEHMKTVERIFGPAVVQAATDLLKEEQIEGLFVMEIKQNNTYLYVNKLPVWKKK